MKKIIPEPIVTCLDGIEGVFAEFMMQRFYRPEMLTFDQGYYMSVELFSHSYEDSEKLHAELEALGYEFKYESQYEKNVTCNEIPLTIEIQFDADYMSFHVYPSLSYRDHIGIHNMSLALHTQKFIYGLDNSADVDPVQDLEGLNFAFLPNHVISGIFKAMREAAKHNNDVNTYTYTTSNSEVHQLKK